MPAKRKKRVMPRAAKPKKSPPRSQPTAHPHPPFLAVVLPFPVNEVSPFGMTGTHGVFIPSEVMPGAAKPKRAKPRTKSNPKRK